MRLKRIRLLHHVFLTFTLFFLISASFFWGTFLPVYSQNHSHKLISSQGRVNYEVPTPPSSSEKFLSVFHTGACLWDVYGLSVWAPARDAGVIKWGMGAQNIPEIGRRAWLQTDGSITGCYTNSRIQELIQTYLVDYGVIPVFETNFENFETISESTWRNWFTNLGKWVDSADPSKFIIWDCGPEPNFPDGDDGWKDFKIDWRDHNRQMKVIRKVRDALGLQNKVLLASHINLHKSYYVSATGQWVAQDWYTGFVGIEEYLEGYAQCDIIGFSHYMAYSNPSYNPGGLSWQETLQRSWKRTQIISEMINDMAGETLPVLFLEFSLGNVWKYDNDPMWKEGVTYVYEQMVKKNKWVQGLNWYTGGYFDADAMQELVEVAKEYDGH